MKSIVSSYINSRNEILNRFQCYSDYFIKPIEGYKWTVIESDGIFFLKYWLEGGKVNKCVITKKGSMPYVVRSEDYTMIVCIECVKIAIIAANANEVSAL